MNRLARRNFVANVYGFKARGKSFCSEAAAKVSGSNGDRISVQEDRLSSTNNFPQYDIAIVGGGMVGLALACSLASMPLTKQLTVAIIDSNPALKDGVCIKKDDPPDPRVSTVTPATISLFKDIDAWKYVEEHRHAYFDKMQVWDYTGLGYTKYLARDVNREILGCVVENKVLQGSLFSRLLHTDTRTTIHPSRLISMNLLPSFPSSAAANISSRTTLDEPRHLAKLELSDGSSLYAKLVVGADGSKSRVRELAGFKTTGWNYSQNAVICTVEHADINHCAWQRFLPSGPIALLPIGGNFSNIVWTMNPKEAMDRKSMNQDDFVKDANHALNYCYGSPPKSSIFGTENWFSWLKPNVTVSVDEGFEVPPKVVKLASDRMAFPLSLMHANNYASKRVVLIGDAAHTVHPLAGQGVNLGFGDAISLSKTIADGVALGIDIGEVTLLTKYEAERKPANIAMMAILDGFQKAYSVDFGPLNILRAAAFHGAHHISPLKKSIISYASGDRRLPLFA